MVGSIPNRVRFPSYVTIVANRSENQKALRGSRFLNLEGLSASLV